MMNYIYMSGEAKKSPVAKNKKLVFFKVGYSKDPVRRGGQLTYALNREFGIHYHLGVTRNHTQAIGDKEAAQKVEAYILDKVGEMARTVIGREFFIITRSNRAKCYKMLPQWCAEALAQ